MGVRGVLAAVVGVVQSGIGVSAIGFAYVLNYNDGVRKFVKTMLDIERPIEEVLPAFLLIIVTFGFFSITSGLLLIHEWRRSR